ncbi:hypothetical protein ERICIV_00424 [Paenibacillus larvae subsp. larvae]|uniref:Uncharacterized protein n=1 Tax=Paenibacillus larvae subsp. larvae TaxID=147375 RepID=A0A2L1TVE1_9BACL|nr:hypothetical protein [Paenibacillus larvae]AQT85349.1 hypothetical protein B1222_14540 [Paenibacillus larvae subsp. pulvifaciens]AQZ47351.1 hypothetical protein B5S25_12900 [Paenibacillus larvae subsp. pulvifaciens]AVF24660.1 hypothetical protein ERICIII_00424 [Paenibacillus larvae subsp. larvae]AVF29421.1 hypothetical protein ERICIV_00424 [Paenibacillus larvae subsp. larvae]MBH0343136.1 hypothetical protein [Paenibacillus larvae]
MLVDMQLHGWLLDHEDLVDQQIGLVAGSGNPIDIKTSHGTATLGEVVGCDNEVSKSKSNIFTRDCKSKVRKTIHTQGDKRPVK